MVLSVFHRIQQLLHSIPLRYKLAILSTISALIGLVVAGSVVLSVYSKEEKQQEMMDVRSLLTSMAQTSIPLLDGLDDTSLHNHLQVAAGRHSIQLLCAYPPDGSLVAEYSHPDFKLSSSECPVYRPQFAMLVATLDRNDLIPVSKILTDPDSGTLLVSFHALVSFQYIQADIWDGIYRLLTLMLVVGVIIFWMNHRLLVSGLKSLQRLSDTANSVMESGDFAIRADKLASDEVGLLVDSFNSMMDELQREQEDIAANEQRFRSLATHSPVGIFQRDAQGNFLYVNQRWSEMTGVDIRTLNNLSQRFESTIYPTDAVRFVKQWQTAIKKSAPFTMEYSIARAEAMLHVVEYASPVGGPQGGFIGTVIDVSELKHAQNNIEKLAFYDPLTGLANRRLFYEHLGKVIDDCSRKKSRAALIMLDLDNFKRLNDSLGHDAGDKLLIEVAQRLRRSVRKNDLVTRMGGDEFMIVANYFNTDGGVRTVAENIQKAISEVIPLDGNDVLLTCSLGIAAIPEDGDQIKDLLKNAEMAMYEAKESGRNDFRFYRSELNQRIVDAMRIENEIRTGIKNNEFMLYIQPQFCLHQHRMVSGELLLRWNHPEKGIVAPNYFMEVAEQSGLIIALGEWVLKEAGRMAQVLCDTGGLDYLSVNLSAKQFASDSLVKIVQETVESYDIEPNGLMLEITESMVMENIDVAIEKLSELKNIGVKLSVDDFGTGYSSLAYLKKFPIDELKVDRSFVMDIPQDRNDMEIVAAVIAMAHKLDLEVVAEGVETEAQLAFLERNGCDILQGYLIGRPMPEAEMLKYSMPKIESLKQASG